MDYIQAISEGRAFNIEELQSVLDGSLYEGDFFNQRSRHLLKKLGLKKNEALMLLAHYKSKIKYGYDLSTRTLSHILRLSQNDEKGTSLKKLIESPFFLIKASWLYDHAPHFFFFNEYTAEDLDHYIINFAEHYENRFLQNTVSMEQWDRISNLKRVLASSFWEKQILDPVLLLDEVRRQQIEGIEISIDFHPFNYTKLLPEELSKTKREQIKEICCRSGIKLDIHSPIVGPYFPFPNPRGGRQLFSNPLECSELHAETIELAKDIGAGSVVVHLIDTSNPKKLVDLIMKAAGSDVRVTVENYCQTKDLQNSSYFLEFIDEICTALPEEVRSRNFGITLDVGHLNIEGEDPLIASERIGRWCLDKKVYLRIHATDNYGKLLFSPPTYSADVHSNVAGLGINNEAIIKLLRSMGLQCSVVAEQIKPLTPEDIAIIHKAQTIPIDKTYGEFVQIGRNVLLSNKFDELITPAVMKENSYLFLAGLEGIDALKEYLVYRKIQERKYLYVEDAKRISQDFMKMPQKIKNYLIRYLDDLLLPVDIDSSEISKSKLDLICQNITGALFGTINNEHLNQIFSQSRTYHQGDIICRQNTIGHEMYFIKEGEVNVFVKGSLVATLGPGEIFGEISLFYNVRRSATIKAAKDKTKVGILSRKSFINLLRRSQPYSYDLIYRLFNILPGRLRNINDKYKSAIHSIHSVLHEWNQKDNEMLSAESPIDLKLKTDLIPPLSQEEAEMLFKEGRELDADQFIFSEGDDGDCVYYILEGRVKVITHAATNREIKYGELGKGEIFGEMAVIDNRPRAETIVTMTPCKVAFVRKDEFIDLLETRSDFAFRLMSYICVGMFERIIRLDKVYTEIKNWIRYL